MVTLVTQVIGMPTTKAQAFSPDRPIAAVLGAAERGKLSVQVLAKTQPVSHLAAHFGVSRKFVYRQAAKASEAIEDAFAPPVRDQSVLFNFPVTKDWIRQFVLDQVLIGHTSFRGVMSADDVAALSDCGKNFVTSSMP